MLEHRCYRYINYLLWRQTNLITSNKTRGILKKINNKKVTQNGRRCYLRASFSFFLVGLWRLRREDKAFQTRVKQKHTCCHFLFCFNRPFRSSAGSIEFLGLRRIYRLPYYMACLWSNRDFELSCSNSRGQTNQGHGSNSVVIDK